MEPVPTRESRARLRTAATAGVVALIALAVRLAQLDHAPFIDEMNHVLAARSLLEDGDLAILDGRPYGRAWLFTYLVAALYRVLGVGLEIGRLPAVIGGVLLVCLFFIWLRRVGGAVAGWVAALLLCFAPISIYLSQWVRFYTLHALFFWIFVLSVYRLTEGGKRALWIGVGATALLIALHLQETTLVGLGGLSAWLAVLYVPSLLRGWWRSPRRTWIGVAAAAMALTGLGVVFATGVVESTLARFGVVDDWAASRAGNVRFYHQLLEDQYGLLWALWPVAFLVALTRAPRSASLFGAIFAVALVFHSLAAWKSERYLFYALPGMLAVWGLAVAAFVPWLTERLRDLLARIPGPIPGRLTGIGVSAALVLVGLFAAAGVDAFRLSREMMLRPDAEWETPAGHLGEWYRGWPDWASARNLLAPVSDSAAVMISSNDLSALFYLDRVDYVLSAGRLMQFDGSRSLEFALDWKTGRPVISAVESIDLIMDCQPSGLIVVEEHVWGWSGGVPDSTAAFIASQTDEVPLPPEVGLLAFRWRNPVTASDSLCARLSNAGP